MNIEDLRNYCLSKPHATEDLPFGDETLVFKIGGKIFLLVGLDHLPIRFNVKCSPDRAADLRSEYPEHVLPGYHMNKTHWNTLVMDGLLPASFLLEQIDHSYYLVLASLTAKVRAQLG